jgi:hypothetical protein
MFKRKFWPLILLAVTAVAYAGLETVTHIQDLNASWPLGSDLASTSDDHVRNIKSALKTDFPNFNGTYTSAALPVFAIPSDTNTGMYSVGADDLGFSTGGTLRFDISTTAFTGTLPFRGQDGTVSAPALSFSGDTDTGLYRVGANTIGVTVNGSNIAQFLGNGAGEIDLSNGTASFPSFSFISDTDTGMYRAGANALAFAAGGTAFAVGTASVFSMQTGIQLQSYDGSAGTPGISFFSDTDTGFYRDTANQIGIGLGGVTAGQIAQGTFTATYTGFTANPTGTATWMRNGQLVTLCLPNASATSNATTFTMTGLPAAIQPATLDQFVYVVAVNNGTTTSANALITHASGTVTFYLSFSSVGWTNTGTKAIGTASACVPVSYLMT